MQEHLLRQRLELESFLQYGQCVEESHAVADFESLDAFYLHQL